MKNINYNERNAFKSLGTFAFVILWIFIKMIFAGFLKIIINFDRCKTNAKYLYKYVTNELFFNIFIESTIEGFFGLLICGYLNIRTQ